MLYKIDEEIERERESESETGVRDKPPRGGERQDGIFACRTVKLLLVLQWLSF